MESGRCTCGAISDQLGYHALHCRFGGGTIRRHNRIRDTLFHACRAAGLLPELETPGILPGGEKRPDVFVNRWPGGGPALLALDVAVVSPTQTTYVKGQESEQGQHRDPLQVKGHPVPADGGGDVWGME